MESIITIILAAGKGTRMKSDLVKTLHPLLGVPMLSYPVKLSLNDIKAEKTILVVGHQADKIKEKFRDPRIHFVLQEQQLGTGHAVLQALPYLQSFNGTVLILCGDVPLVKMETLRSFIDTFWRNESKLSVLTAVVENPTGYGRIIRGPTGWLEKIVEEKDGSEDEKLVREINTGIYCIKAPFLIDSLKEIGQENAQGEYYLTELVEIGKKRGVRCSAHMVADPTEVMGINTRADLAVANEVLRQEKVMDLMLSGVTIIDPKTAYVEKTVEIGKDTIVHPNCVLQGKTKIGERCVIESNSSIVDSLIGNEVLVHSNSVITESKIGDGASIGPFAHLRPSTEIKAKAKIGSFDSRVRQMNIKAGRKRSDPRRKKNGKKRSR
jgi:bifunctional UDP-N-acetylglucosamine pyrophosphorylase/glucosamine-1-phosphate N-acetyltransferase